MSMEISGDTTAVVYLAERVETYGDWHEVPFAVLFSEYDTEKWEYAMSFSDLDSLLKDNARLSERGRRRKIGEPTFVERSEKVRTRLELTSVLPVATSLLFNFTCDFHKIEGVYDTYCVETLSGTFLGHGQVEQTTVEDDHVTLKGSIVLRMV